MKLTNAAITAFLTASACFALPANATNSLRGTNERRLQSAAQSSNTIPYLHGCAIGQGFNPYSTKGCLENAIDLKQGQIKQSNDNIFDKPYMETIRTSEQLVTTMSSFSSAQGSYSAATFSASASVTAKFMSNSQMSANSVTFFLGRTIKNHEKSVPDNIVADLQLSKAAFDLLQNDVEAFVEQYGVHFIQTVQSGSTFAGSLSYYSKTTADEHSLDVLAEFKASTLFFSASATEHYQSSFSKATSNLHLDINAVSTGGGVGSFIPSGGQKDPNNVALPLTHYYQRWEKGIKQHSQPMSMIYGNYLSIQQVSDYIATLPSDQKTKYMAYLSGEPISSQTMQYIQIEGITTRYVLNGLEQAKHYDCYKKDDKVSEQINNWLTQISGHLTEISSSMTQGRLDEIQKLGRYGKNSTDFYFADIIQKEYQELLDTNPQCKPPGVMFCSAYSSHESCLRVDGWNDSRKTREGHIRMPPSNPIDEAVDDPNCHFEMTYLQAFTTVSNPTNLPFVVGQNIDEDDVFQKNSPHLFINYNDGTAGLILTENVHGFSNGQLLMALPIDENNKKEGPVAICSCSQRFTGETMNNFCSSDREHLCWTHTPGSQALLVRTNVDGITSNSKFHWQVVHGV